MASGISLPASMCGSADGRGVEGGDTAAEHVLQRRGAALVGHVHGVDPGDVVQQFAGQVRGGAGAGGGEVQLAGLALGLGDELAERFHAGAGGHHEHVREGHAHGDGGQVLQRVVAHLHHVGRDAQRAHGAEQQHGTIRRAVGDPGMGELAARAGLVLDDDALADVFAQLLGDDAGRDVGRAAGSEADHEGHGFLGREVLRMGGSAGEGQAGSQGGGQHERASLYFRWSPEWGPPS